MMLRILLDTNVLISALISKGKPRTLLRQAYRNKFILILSIEILNEFIKVANREHFYEYVDEREIAKFTSALTRLAHFAIQKSKFEIVKEDPDNDIVLRTAYDGHVDYIVTGDKHLSSLKEFKGIKIKTVSEMLKILQKK
jgi:putative PIN family toxin of toxin-antitoxin system